MADGSEFLGPSAAASFFNRDFVGGRTATINAGNRGYTDDLSSGLAREGVLTRGFETAAVLNRGLGIRAQSLDA